MKNQMDKLFKEKLENHTLLPSEEAWARVEAKLSKKNNVVAWRIAAAILLMGVFISLMYWQQTKENASAPTLAETPTSKENKAATPTPPANNPVAMSPTKKTSQPSSTTIYQKKAESSAAQHVIEQKEETSVTLVIETPKENAVALVNEKKEEEKIIRNATSTTTLASSTQKPIKLEFTLDDFASEENVVATTEVKNTGLKRVLELAKEVKNGEGPVNDLREMKNELFAFNFIKNKTKN